MVEGQPEFNENIELFKLQILSEDERAYHYTFVAAFLAVFAGFGIYLIQSKQPFVTFTVALVLSGVGLLFAILVFSSIPHRRFINTMNGYIKQVQRREKLPDLIDLYRKGRRVGNWLSSRKTRSSPPGQQRGLGFFLVLAVTLWFTGFFAWSQTVLWQSVLSDISQAKSGNDVAMISAEGIAETLIVSALFAFYLWVVYSVSASFREVVDGIFGLRRTDNRVSHPVS
ncbi:MAG TPA: hypothetical protein VFV92_01665 [Candidatus Bathyarchaeia archaeon]|nr:hypothetical protein [Candidatus Bathyarchaeia archaeon]